MARKKSKKLQNPGAKNKNVNSKKQKENTNGDKTIECSDEDMKRREKYINTVKKEMKFFNYGLPPNPKYIDVGWDEVRKEFVALRELWVRLNVFEANGESQKGIIKYPEANRIIDYNLDGNNVNNSYIRFRSTRNIDSVECA